MWLMRTMQRSAERGFQVGLRIAVEREAVAVQVVVELGEVPVGIKSNVN